ncbi:hypothetical protein BLNAU_7119 [Blattamonas nauphoetae]|uniref:Uncharacterized protein n=1 Tax=Blattamonas nauphoetae TaxID=2049346 RepID=A0ABQ9Y2H7_9EUKA|nr:hypothetical protein BLNAU_7119 [Blattamonas nauphoetae]
MVILNQKTGNDVDIEVPADLRLDRSADLRLDFSRSEPRLTRDQSQVLRRVRPDLKNNTAILMLCVHGGHESSNSPIAKPTSAAQGSEGGMTGKWILNIENDVDGSLIDKYTDSTSKSFLVFDATFFGCVGSALDGAGALRVE